jgi:hypothetical protein
MPQPIEVLGAMITPAVLISAAALLLLSTAARMGRVNERLMHLVTEIERMPQIAHESEPKSRIVLEQMSSLAERLLLLRSAAIAIYLAIALLVITSICSGMYVVFPQMTSLVPIGLGLFGAIAFLYSLVMLIQEAVIAVRVSIHEVAYVRELLATRKAAPGK